MTIDELMAAGGVEGLARAAALDAANETRREWLGVLEAVAQDSEPDDDIATVGYVTREIATLRRRLGITTPSDTVREQVASKFASGCGAISSAARVGIARADHSKRPTRNTRSIAVVAAAMSSRLPVSAAVSSNRIA